MISFLVLRPEAEKDLAEARDWYELKREGLGREFILEVDKAFDHICQFPEAYAVEYKGVRRAGLRRFPYVVYYRIIGEIGEVLAVLHGGRRTRTWRERA